MKNMHMYNGEQNSTLINLIKYIIQSHYPIVKKNDRNSCMEKNFMLQAVLNKKSCSFKPIRNTFAQFKLLILQSMGQSHFPFNVTGNMLKVKVYIAEVDQHDRVQPSSHLPFPTSFYHQISRKISLNF